MTYRPGDLPTAPRESYEADTDILTTAMRLAIPTEDWGSRAAIQYAIDITEALAFLHVKLEPLPTFDPDFIVAQKASLDRLDKPMTV